MEKVILSVFHKIRIFIIVSFLSLHFGAIFCQGTIVILYGCSSAGKTSISAELGKTLSGKWKVLGIDMFSNKEGTANSLLWKQAAKDLKAGYDLVIDTVFPEFLYDHLKDYRVFVVVTYCSPNILVEHVKKRNMSDRDKDHRTLKKVLGQYCNKYRHAQNKQDSIDVLHESDIKNIDDWRARRKIREEFFNNNRHVVYIASKLYQYDFVVNTGKASIPACAKKIKEAFLAFMEKDRV